MYLITGVAFQDSHQRIFGKAQAIAALRRHPLTRALRVDKTTIAGIQTNLLHYLKGEAQAEVPIWQMISMTQQETSERATELLGALGSAGRRCALIAGRSMVGGGSLPEESLPTTLVALPGSDAEALARTLRCGQPAILARIVEGKVVLDLRTVLPRQLPALVTRLRDLLEA